MSRGALSSRLDALERSGELAAMIKWKPRPEIIDVRDRRWDVQLFRESLPRVRRVNGDGIDNREETFDARGSEAGMMHSIIGAVASEFGVTPKDLRSMKFRKFLAPPRQLVMFLAKEMTGFSWPMIGSFMRGRDHTTIIYGYRRTKERIGQDPEFARRVGSVRARVVTERREPGV